MMRSISVMAVALGLSFAVQAAEPPEQYNMYCVACHATGAAGAPLPGDAAWAARLEAAGGIDGLVASAKAGKNAMPPMGLCMACTDDELKAVVQYLIQK
jgi:cytochrome c5